MEKIMAELQKLGFSQYEAKAYISLLRHNPVTGYELSKRSGVPRSMIYEVINKLIDRGAVYTVPSDPVKYSPVPAVELLKRLRQGLDETFDYLEESLSSLGSSDTVELITRISGAQPVTQELLSIIDGAQEELWLSAWHPQAESFTASVDKALERGAEVFSIIFGAENCRLGATFHHDYMTADVVQERIGGKLTIAARDRKEVVIANFIDNSVAWAVKTHDPALVLVAIEFIRHDIMIEAITRHFGPDSVDEFWRSNPDLRYVVEGKRSE